MADAATGNQKKKSRANDSASLFRASFVPCALLARSDFRFAEGLDARQRAVERHEEAVRDDGVIDQPTLTIRVQVPRSGHAEVAASQSRCLRPERRVRITQQRTDSVILAPR